MPKMNYSTIVAPPVNGKPLGARREQNLKGIFSSSPLYSEGSAAVPGEGEAKLTPSENTQWFLDHVVNGAVTGSDGYYGFTENYNRDFSGAGGSIPGGPPDYASVKTGGGGLPATPFVPNPASPGEGNGVNATAVPEAKDFAAQMSTKKPSTPGSGAAANEDARNPASTSKAMKVTKLSQVLGKSAASVEKGG